MKKPIIAVDVDDVLAASAQAFVEFSNKRWSTRLTLDDVDEDWKSMWQVDYAEERRRANEFLTSGIISAYSHYDEALPVLEWLSRDYTLVIATSRNASINAETRAWIDRHYGGLFDAIHFSGIYDTDDPGDHVYRMTKSSLLASLGASYLIDDQPKHCIGAAEVGLQAVLFGDYPWNRGAELPERVTRCHSWASVREFFEGIRA